MAYQIPPRFGTIPSVGSVKSPNTLSDIYDIVSSGINTSGGYFTCGDPSNNRLFVTGHNSHGQLGAAFGEHHPHPGCTYGCFLQVPGTNWNNVSTGHYRMYATKTDGTAWIWGNSSHSAGGWGGGSTQSSPIQLPGTNWAMLKGACHSSFGIKCDSTLWAWGHNPHGILGLGCRPLNDYQSPTQIPGNSWKDVCGNANFTVAVKCDGTLWTWGHGNHGMLGLCCITCALMGTCCSPTCFCPQAMGICNNGFMPCCTSNTSTYYNFSSPVQIPGNNWIKAAAGINHTTAIKSDGSMWAWGHNPHGQIGNIATADVYCPVQIPGSTWIDVTASTQRSHARKSDNTLWSWGHNPYGELGDGTTASRSSPVQIPGTTWVKLFCSGTNSNHHSGAIKADGTLWTWGYNPHGELGDCCPGLHRSSPNQVGAATSSFWKDMAGSHHNTIALSCVPSNYAL